MCPPPVPDPLCPDDNTSYRNFIRQIPADTLHKHGSRFYGDNQFRTCGKRFPDVDSNVCSAVENDVSLADTQTIMSVDVAVLLREQNRQHFSPSLWYPVRAPRRLP